MTPNTIILLVILLIGVLVLNSELVLEEFRRPKDKHKG